MDCYQQVFLFSRDRSVCRRGACAWLFRPGDGLSGAIKKPVTDRLSRQPGNNPQSALQRADVLAKAAFMTGSLVFMEQALADGFVDNRNSFPVGGLGSFRITGGNCFNDIFDLGAQRGALASLALTAVFRLMGAFTRLSRVCQDNSPVPGSKEPSTMRISTEVVNVAALK
jgi:hypothetical protein